MGFYRKVFAVMAIALSLSGALHARKHSIGTSWSFAGIGITYNMQMKEDAFIRAGARIEMSEPFLGRSLRPGASASFTWNNIYGSTLSRNGNLIRFFAGAGAEAGFCKDFRLARTDETLHGGFLGLKGTAGINIRYERNIDITIAVAPVLGMHLSIKDETVMMRYYRYGLLQTIMPEITISYRF